MNLILNFTDPVTQFYQYSLPFFHLIPFFFHNVALSNVSFHSFIVIFYLILILVKNLFMMFGQFFVVQVISNFFSRKLDRANH